MGRDTCCLAELMLFRNALLFPLRKTMVQSSRHKSTLIMEVTCSSRKLREFVQDCKASHHKTKYNKITLNITVFS